MKILNNKTANITGSQIICGFCGANLLMEADDPKLYNKETEVIKTTPFSYHGKEFLFVRKYIGELYLVTCASCHRQIGFVRYGHNGIGESALVNPERYWVKQEDDGFYVVDIAKSIQNDIYNEDKLSSQYQHECHGDIYDYVIIEEHSVPVYGEIDDSVLEVVQKEYPGVTEDNQHYRNGMYFLKQYNTPGGEGYVNNVFTGIPCVGGIYSCNVRTDDSFVCC